MNRTRLKIYLFLGALHFVSGLGAFAQPGAQRWAYPTGDAVLSSPAFASGTVYVGSYDQFFYAIDAASGSLRWRFSLKPTKPAQTAYVYSSPAVASDGTIYFGTEESSPSSGASTGNFYALNADGTLKWKFPVNASIYSDPSIGSDGTVYFGCYDAILYALTPAGTLKWQFTAGSTIFSDPVLAADGTIYFGCDDHNLYALDARGHLKWTFDTGGPVTASPAVGPDGTVYLGTTSSMKFFAVNPNGTQKWAFQTSERIYSSAALGSDGTVYFGSNDGHLYALNPQGSLKWQFTAGGLVRSSPAIAADGTIYFGCDDGYVYALDANGNKLWSFPTTAYVYSSPVLGTDGTVYIGSADHTLYAITGSSGMAATPWPMLHHDASHTGRLVAIANQPPTISFIPDQTVLEDGTVGPLPFNISDAETPPADLSLSGASLNTLLVSNTGIVFGGSSTNRTVTITPSANQTGTTTITLVVIDNGAPSMSATQTFLVVVRVGNTAPVLAPISNRIVQPGATLSFTVAATDSDIPANILTYSLLAAPAGATIDAATGFFTWTPDGSQANTTNLVTVQVTDNGTPNLSDQKTFTITVPSNPTPVIQAIRLSGDIVTLAWTAVPGGQYRVQSASTLTATTWIDLLGDIQASSSLATKQDTSAGSAPLRFYRVILLP